MLHHRWLEHLHTLRDEGNAIGPRGFATRELLDQRMMIFDARRNLLDVPARGMNYRFAVAEWIWMMFGHSAVEPIAQYNGIMRQFSDDGIWLTGAYGPHIAAQKHRVLRKLQEDPATRQAVIEIPRPQMLHTKDEPCTLSLQYLQRDGCLNCIVSMRSSDAWLGVPYDIYTFTMIQNCFAGALGVQVGWLSLRMGSAHLYERDFDAVERVMNDEKNSHTLVTPQLPGLPPAWLEHVMLTRQYDSLPKLMDSDPWLPYAKVLLSSTSDDARAILRVVSVTDGHNASTVAPCA